MATVKVDSWDNTIWDNAVTARTIAIGDTFTVMAINQTNYQVTFAPASTSFTANLIARSWEDNYAAVKNLSVSQTFTVNLLDYNNRVVWLTG